MNLNFIKKFFLSNFKETIIRFPLPILCCLALTFLGIIEIHKIDIIKIEPWFYRFLLCGFLSYTILKLFCENHPVSPKQYGLLILALGAFLFYFCLAPDPIRLSLLFSGLFLLLLIAPYIFNDMGETACCNFNTKMAASIFFSALATIILCGGLSLTLVSIQYLFNVKINANLFGDIWIVGVTFFAPFYALSGIPHDFKPQEKQYPKGIAFIFSYILAPLIIIYFAILYAYIFKVTSQWNLPKGNVAYMVLTFGIIGIFTHIFSYPLRQNGTKLLKLFYRYFYYALLAPVILLCVGIWVRITDYGVTESRYLVIIFAIWFFISSCSFIFKKEPRFKNIILTIAIMMILSSFGFWGAVHISQTSQVNRLQQLLEKNNILVNGSIVKASNDINFEDQRSISSIVQYLSKGKKTEPIKPWFSKTSYINTTNDTQRLNSTLIMQDMGISYVNQWQTERSNRFNFSSHQTSSNTTTLHKIENFDYYANVGYVNFSQNKIIRNLDISDNVNKNLQLHVDGQNTLIVKYPAKNSHLTFDFSYIVKTLMHDGIKTGPLAASKTPLLTVEQENAIFKVRIYLTNINGTIKDEPIISDIHCVVAVQYFD